jgi:hypothetical protein
MGRWVGLRNAHGPPRFQSAHERAIFIRPLSFREMPHGGSGTVPDPMRPEGAWGAGGIMLAPSLAGGRVSSRTL